MIDVVYGVKGVDTTFIHPTQKLLAQIRFYWASPVEVVLGSFDITVSGTRKPRRIFNPLWYIGDHSAKLLDISGEGRVWGFINWGHIYSLLGNQVSLALYVERPVV